MQVTTTKQDMLCVCECVLVCERERVQPSGCTSACVHSRKRANI